MGKRQFQLCNDQVGIKQNWLWHLYEHSKKEFNWTCLENKSRNVISSYNERFHKYIEI